MDRRSFVTAAAALGCCGPLAVSALAQSPHTHEHGFGGAQDWARIFDDPGRDAWQKPHEVIQALALGPGAIVADIGAGTGYFSTRLAHMLPKGHVYAVDTERDMVKHLAQRAKSEALKNMTAVAGQADTPKLPRPVDLALFVDVYHHITRREDYFRRLAKSLKGDGRVAIIDFRMDSPDGPPKAARIEPERVKAELGSAGYELVREHDFLPKQYFLIFRRSKT
jgi:cyclopropane fatty-acyl-phospholipid synthase-like methyltransferase